MTGASESSTGSLLKRRMFLLLSMTCLLQPGVQDLELAVPVNRSMFSHLRELQEISSWSQILVVLRCSDWPFYFLILAWAYTAAVPEAVANRSQCGDLNFKTLHLDLGEAPLRWRTVINVPLLTYKTPSVCLTYRRTINETRVDSTTNSKENVLLNWGWKVAFSYSSGEEEDPWGGDPLSTRGLRAVGLLRCPRQGHCSFLSFHIFIRPSSYLCHWVPYWLTHLHLHIWKRNVMWQRPYQIFWLCLHVNRLLAEFRQ